VGRSSAEQALLNRAKIIEAASRLFRLHGIEAVSVADIMGSLGLTVGGFYKHFASKDALVEEATALAFDEARAFWRRLLSQSDPALADQRRRLVERYLRPDPNRSCPVTAFAPHAATAASVSAARRQYDQGTEALLAQFCHGAEPDPQSLLIFAAMVGARVLGEAAGAVPWVTAIKAAVIAAAQEDRTPPIGKVADSG